jgi:hypothetical protein
MIGMTKTFDGRASLSPEQRPLTFRWRLVARPAASTAALGGVDGSTTTLTPDVPGEYGVELRVFDGELWGVAATAGFVAR